MRCVLDGVENCWKRRCRVTLNSQILSFSTWTLGWYTKVEQWWASLSERMGDPMGVFPLWRTGSSYTGEWCRGPGEGQNASYAQQTDPCWVDGGLLWNSVLGQRFPTFDLGRYVGGSANLAAALWVWQTQDFSSALCSAKPKMCLARNASLIFKPLCIF